MTILFLFSLLAADDNLVSFRGTDIFEPISRGEVAVTADGQVYMLNFHERFIRHWDADGKVVNTFGRKGNGPGELNFPEGFFMEGDRFYINDMGNDQVHSFRTDGSFVESVRLPAIGLTIVKVKGGWATANFRGGPGASQDVTVRLTDDRFGNGESMLSWPREGTGGGIVVERDGSGVPKVKFNPVSERPFLATSPEGRYLYVCHPKGLKISVIDTSEKKVIHTIDRDVQPIPFNEEYGQEQLRRLKEDRQAGGHAMQIDFEPDFPEHFPVVRNFFTSGEGYLAVEQWTARPDEMERAMLLDRTGNERKAAYDPIHADRVVAVRGNDAFVTVHDDDDDEGYLVKCPADKVDQFVAANPITAKRAPRMLIRTN